MDTQHDDAQHDFNTDNADHSRLARLVNDAMQGVAVGTVFDSRSPLEKTLAANRARTSSHFMLLAALVVLIGSLTVIMPLLFS